MDHFDKDKYSCSYKTVQRHRSNLGLLGARQRKATFEYIAPYVHDIRERFPNQGARVMGDTLRQDYGIKVSKNFLLEFFKVSEPEAVRRRKLRRFRRKRFWSAGVMDIIAVDQHDKWKRFGLWLHVGLDPFTGHIAWLCIWWTNHNSCLICSYYIKAGHEVGGIPLHQNVKPEALWSQLRHQFTPGLEDVLDQGFNQGIYNPDDPLEKLVFRWLVIPWLQAKLDKWKKQYNSTPRRANKNKVLPHGIPDLIHAKPHLFDSVDFTVRIEEQWAPTTDPVFSCIPPLFDLQANQLYIKIGSPPIALSTFWAVFSNLLNVFFRMDGVCMSLV
ncbi:hypothetical protein DFH07DRAFT_866290 [Mycena maculata]|uniref:Uncharacterized protein n=1 Tax=Mycena maculata TaxID=230809 RepID=A0AAD7NR02_9AGAR|nr:hypothetical protein DFH07DRAFT_866290 [Mycena maculata]